MRKMLFTLSLAGLAMLVVSSGAFAQPRSGGGGRGGSSNVGRASTGRASVSRSYGGGGYAGRGNAGRGYGGSGYYGGGYGGGYYGGGLGLGLLGSEYSPYYQGTGYAPNYYNTAPVYSNYSGLAITNGSPQVRQSYYPSAPQDFANMTVLVPTADAQVWFQNTPTTQQGTQRFFNSPALTPNEDFTYTIKARWTENGKTINQERQIQVQAGQNITVDFNAKNQEVVTMPVPQPGPVILQK